MNCYDDSDNLTTVYINFRQWDCDGCKWFVGAIAHVYGSEHGIHHVIRHLEGEAFCENPELGLDHHQQHDCHHKIEHFMPQALHVVGHALHENSGHICRDWFHGICHHE